MDFWMRIVAISMVLLGQKSINLLVRLVFVVVAVVIGIVKRVACHVHVSFRLNFHQYRQCKFNVQCKSKMLVIKCTKCVTHYIAVMSMCHWCIQHSSWNCEQIENGKFRTKKTTTATHAHLNRIEFYMISVSVHINCNCWMVWIFGFHMLLCKTYYTFVFEHILGFIVSMKKNV